MDITNRIASNAKRLREQKKLTLDAAANLTGVSRSMLAQIEKGEVNPTISVLWKIANGYKVSFTSLVEDQGEAVCVIRGNDMEPLKRTADAIETTLCLHSMSASCLKPTALSSIPTEPCPHSRT